MKCPTPTKINFKDERTAWLKAFELYLRDFYDNSPYHCKCGKWHLTSRRKPLPDFIIRIMKVYNKFGKLPVKKAAT